jgi:hypothetical protein
VCHADAPRNASSLGSSYTTGCAVDDTGNRIHQNASLLSPLAVIAREEGRLAALAGDREGAIRAYRRYLAIRVDPVERLKPEVESVRKELARLVRQSAGK